MLSELSSRWCSKRLPCGPVNLVIIQASLFCNLDCDYCYLPNRSNTERLSLDLLDPIFRNLFASLFVQDSVTIVWHAGEPLAVPLSYYQAAFDRIRQLDQQANRCQVSIHHAMQTNATLVNPAWCDFIEAHSTQMGVSLDGPALIHDAHRKTRSGRGTHARVMEGIALFQQHDIDFRIIAVLTLDALDYPDEMFDFFLHHGIRRIGFNVEEIEGVNRTSSLQQTGAESQYRTFMARFYQLCQQHPSVTEVREFERIRQTILQDEPVISGQCLPFSMINIAHNGDFSTFSPELLTMPAPDYGDFRLGNVLQDTFEEVMQKRKFRRINADIQAGVARCRRSCEYFLLCGSGAPANKYFENQSLRSTETMYCRFTLKILVDIVLHGLETELGLSHSE